MVALSVVQIDEKQIQIWFDFSGQKIWIWLGFVGEKIYSRFDLIFLKKIRIFFGFVLDFFPTNNIQ